MALKTELQEAAVRVEELEGVVVKYKKLLIGCAIGCFVAGFLVGLLF